MLELRGIIDGVLLRAGEDEGALLVRFLGSSALDEWPGQELFEVGGVGLALSVEVDGPCCLSEVEPLGLRVLKRPWVSAQALSSHRQSDLSWPGQGRFGILVKGTLVVGTWVPSPLFLVRGFLGGGFLGST